MSAFGLVIFDCDGVLVDSERISNRVLAEMLNELGLPVTLDDMFEQFVGRSWAQCLELITSRLGREPPANFTVSFRARARAALESELKPVHGIAGVLEGLTLPYCVASSGDHEKMRLTLGTTGLLDQFRGRMFSVTEVRRAKPWPDVFLHAADRCGVPPHSCLVIEDTPTGVAAGVAAGMTVFGYSALTPAARLLAAGAHRTFDDMSALPMLISAATAHAS